VVAAKNQGDDHKEQLIMRSRGFTLAFAFAVASAIAVQSAGQGVDPDRQFAHEAAMINMTEIELGKLAADRGSHARVKEFGNRMVNDHMKVFDELKALAGRKNIALPSELETRQKTLRDKLAGMSGQAFDRAYMEEMVKGHQNALALFQKESTSGADSELKAWAAKTLSGISTHHALAQEIQMAAGLAKT
jgi:putative membrane protein